MHLVFALVLAFLLAILHAVKDTTDFVQKERYKKKLVPYGTAIEYKLASAKYKEIWEQYAATADQGLSSAERWKPIEEKIYAEMRTYGGNIYRVFDRNARHGADLMRRWPVVYARLETAKRGRNPLCVGEKIPKPLPDGVDWALVVGKTPLSSDPWNHGEFSQYAYDHWLRIDEASERELVRMQHE